MEGWPHVRGVLEEPDTDERHDVITHAQADDDDETDDGVQKCRDCVPQNRRELGEVYCPAGWCDLREHCETGVDEVDEQVSSRDRDDRGLQVFLALRGSSSFWNMHPLGELPADTPCSESGL